MNDTAQDVIGLRFNKCYEMHLSYLEGSPEQKILKDNWTAFRSFYEQGFEDSTAKYRARIHELETALDKIFSESRDALFKTEAR